MDESGGFHAGEISGLGDPDGALRIGIRRQIP
jgi:hypothetical protein